MVVLSDSLPVKKGRELMTPITGQSEEAPQQLDEEQGESRENLRTMQRREGGTGGG